MIADRRANVSNCRDAFDVQRPDNPCGDRFHGSVALIFCSAIARCIRRLARCGSTTAASRARWRRQRGGALRLVSRCARTGTIPRSQELQLHVAVIPALRLEPAADPLFILSGGPGQAASDFYLSVAPAFARIRRDRDIVLVDQRGTGRSNRLDCTFPDDSDFTVLDPPKLQALVHACLASMPGDPRYYTTSVAVRDLEDVRAALGYAKVNLYGISYGTRVAQHYMRRYPDRVRTAILDGAVPADVRARARRRDRSAARARQRLARCARDADCARAFPDIPAQFTACRNACASEPVHRSIPHPLTGALTSTQLDAARWAPRFAC